MDGAIRGSPRALSTALTPFLILADFSTLSAEASSSGIGNSATTTRVNYSAGWALAVAVIAGLVAGGVAGS